MSDTIEKIKCLIIGSGPAGYTAAIYAARADMQPVMYTGMQMGGQLTTTTEVDNFPGYPKGTDGTAMMEDLKTQAERFGTEVRFGLVTKVEFSDKIGGIHKITVDETKIIEAASVIISTGATAKYLHIESEQRLIGGGVSANNRLRKEFTNLTKKENVRLYLPNKKYTGDNALMIAIAGYFRFKENKYPKRINKVNGNLKLE